MATKTEIKLYDQLPTEPAKWFGRFNIYLSLGHTRSILKAYRQEKNLEARRKGAESAETVPLAAPGEWHLKAREFKWEERAAAYDREKNSIYLEQYEDTRREALERFREDTLTLAKLTYEVTQKALTVINKVLTSTLETKEIKLTLAELPNFMRAASDAMEKATAVGATVLNVERLLKEINDRKIKPQ